MPFKIENTAVTIPANANGYNADSRCFHINNTDHEELRFVVPNKIVLKGKAVSKTFTAKNVTPSVDGYSFDYFYTSVDGYRILLNFNGFAAYSKT